jgi:aspartyl-tRNA(Asn)/glutamyl-tRNA(Gln) amidotransferase subunit C
MALERSDLLRVAQLARLELSESELEQLTRDCRAILQYFGALRELDVSNVEPWSPAGDGTPLRDDRVDPDPLLLAPEQLAPAWREGFFVLPRLPAMDAEDEDADEGLGGP